MKPCLKPAEPHSLTGYRTANPNATWDQMRDDAFYNGQQAARDCKTALVRGQRCLCAYCESKIADDNTAEAVEARKHHQRVEHFHPKTDPARPPNWNLHWPNLWAVCHGGSESHGTTADAGCYPLPENLSCDAHKDYLISLGDLPPQPEGWLLAPNQVPPFPPLFQFTSNGVPEPHQANCAATVIPNNRHGDTATLVAKTIEHLNLNCPRLNGRRCIVRAQLEKRIMQVRQNANGAQAQQVLLGLARRLFSNNANSPWPEFFSLIRWRLGEPAETHLQSVNFTG